MSRTINYVWDTKTVCDFLEMDYAGVIEETFECDCVPPSGYRRVSPLHPPDHAKSYTVKDKKRERVDFHNLAKFCRDNKLNENMMRSLIAGRINHYEGYTQWHH